MRAKICLCWCRLLRRAHPQVRLSLQQPVGEDPRVLDLLAKIALE